MTEILHKIDASFRACLKGEEDIKVVIRWWGIAAYFFFYFIVNNLIILKIDYKFSDLVFSWIGVIYFAWHIYALIKCSPKKPKLTKEEKKKLRAEKLRNAPKAFMRKLFLQEPISKWNPVGMSIAADLLMFTNFLGYILN